MGDVLVGVARMARVRRMLMMKRRDMLGGVVLEIEVKQVKRSEELGVKDLKIF